jgi:small-conductance mechanosensitive channel
VLTATLKSSTWIIAIAMALGEFGFDLGPLIASAGIVGVGVGLGAQTLVRDILSGIFMLIEDQYGVGDSVDVLDIEGVVEKVGLRVTTVRDGQGTLWYLRNGEILKVGNQSQSG